MTEKRYCIGCIHWSFTKGEPGHVYSTMTSDSDIPAALSCDKRHWEDLDLNEVMQSDIERAMEKAHDCPDYSERPTP